MATVDAARPMTAEEKKVIFASAAPPVKFPNVYGIDMPTRGELVAYGRTHEEIAKIIGADQLVYQDVEDMKRAVRDVNPALKDFDASCFDGKYVTGDIDEAYLDRLETARNNSAAALTASLPLMSSSPTLSRPTLGASLCSMALTRAEPMMPKMLRTPLATIVSTKASEGVIFWTPETALRVSAGA